MYKSVTQRFAALLLGIVVVSGVVLPLGMAQPVYAKEAYDANKPPTVSSAAGLLYDRDTKTVLYEKDADARREPASLTKVMTALLTLEKGKLDDTVTIDSADFEKVSWEGTTAGFVEGETVTVRDLLAGLLLPSGNEAAYALARYVSGDWRSFVELMNSRAAELGCAGTHFENPCGLPDDNHYSTARDLTKILEEAMTHPEFAEISGKHTWGLPATNKSEARTLESTDYLTDKSSPAYDSAVVAAKTGFTNDAGKCVMAAAEQDGMHLAGVVLGAENAPDSDGVPPNFYDLKNLFDWGFGAWRTGDVVSYGDVLGMLKVRLSKDGDSVQGVAKGTIAATVPRSMTLTDLSTDVDWDREYDAPLSADGIVSNATVSLNGRVLGTVGVGAATTMRLSLWKFAINWLADPLHMVIAVVVLVVVFVLVGTLASKKKRRRARRYQIDIQPRHFTGKRR